MKPNILSSYLYAALLCMAFPLSAEEAKSVEIHLSEIELQEIFANPTRSYVYVGSEVSKIAEIMEEISQWAENQDSLVHGLVAHVKKGFNIGNYDAVAQALEEAEALLIARADSLDPERAEYLTRSLDTIIEQVIAEKLSLDAELLSFLKDSVVQEDQTKACCKPKPHCHGLRLLVIKEKLEVLGKAKFKEDVTFKDDVEFEDEVTFEDNALFEAGVTIAGTLSVADEVIGCDLTVGCNINMNNSVDATIGNINKGGAPFMHNFGSNNTYLGTNAGNFFVTGADNTGLGFNALSANIAGGDNTAVGFQALVANDGSGNTAVGSDALVANTIGSFNSAFGQNALLVNTTGSGNVALGMNAGSALTLGNNNVYIANPGVVTESNTMRIGSFGTHTRCFVQGVNGVTTGFAAIPVLVDTTGQFGTISSSESRKHNIQDMNSASDRVMQLRPVTFAFNGDAEETEQYGLIAEEVAQVFPELVALDQEGKPYAVHYETLPALILNELQKLAARVAVLESRLN